MQKAATELEKAAERGRARRRAAPSGVTRVQVEPAPIDVASYLMWGSLGVAAAVGQLVLILFLAFFLLASGDLYTRKMVKIVGPSLTKKKITCRSSSEIDRQIESFLLVQVVHERGRRRRDVARVPEDRPASRRRCGGCSPVSSTRFPYFGPVLVTGGTAVVAFLQFGTICTWRLLVAGVSLVITSLEGFLLTPWLTSRAARMNAVAVFVGLLFWGWVWNVWGMLLAVPMLMVVKAVCDHVEDFEGVGELLGE